MLIRLAGLVSDSIVDGPGMRLAVFTQGCPHHCPGCHNPGSHDPGGGREADTEEVLALLAGNPLQSGVTLTGGEPFLQAAACAEIARGTHARSKNVWTYTGYTFEELLAAEAPDLLALLRETDVLVDGRFEQAQRSLELPFRGSRNQRLVDVGRSLEAGEAVLYELPRW